MKDTEENADVTVLAARRAKLAKLRGEHFVHDRDFTSAPSVTVVDEFESKFGAATSEKNNDTIDRTEDVAHKIFYSHNKRAKNERKSSDLQFNSLVNEANRRGERHSSAVTTASGQGGSDGFSKASSHLNSFGNENASIDIGHRSDDEYGHSFDDEHRKVNNFQLENDENLQKAGRAYSFSGHNFNNNGTIKSKSIKRNSLENTKFQEIYSGSQISHSSEDLGYLSSASSPNESKRRAVILETQKLEVKSTEPKSDVNSLSISLPEASLKSYLAESIKSTTSTCSKVFNDPVMFPGQSKVAPSSFLDPEEDYFDSMKKFHEHDKISGNVLRPNNLPRKAVNITAYNVN